VTHSHQIIAHEWFAPEALIHGLDTQDGACALLLSGLKTSYSGDYSYFACDLLEECSGEKWSQLDALDYANDDFPEWFGTLSYELYHDVSDIPSKHFAKAENAPISFPRLMLMRFARVYRFDHGHKTVSEIIRDGSASKALIAAKPLKTNLPDVLEITSNMDKPRYERIISDTLEQIRAGEFYQANITRKFSGEFASAPSSAQLFAKLHEASPSPYSVFMRLPDGKEMLSSSPELFMKGDASGRLETRPIKGTLGLSQGSADDLLASEKDKAENLMIVDLMRNDLSRVADMGSVEVPALCEVDSFKTLHHMSSTVTAQKRDNVSVLDAIKASFPPGSMTGAPKIAAMRWCAQQERMIRGIYSGAIGWFGKDEFELSVVIRTLLLDGKHFEFQVGGGIVADSKPEKEWKETLIKARGMLKALGVDESRISF